MAGEQAGGATGGSSGGAASGGAGGGQGGSSPSVGSAGGGAAGNGTGGASASPHGSTVAAGGTSAPTTGAAGPWKVKRMGQEVEFKTVDDLVRAASDDYEYEVPINGQPRKFRLPDMVRDYNLAQTSYERMEEAARLRREHDEMLTRGKEDPIWYMTEHLGIEDPDAWAAQQVNELVQLELLKQKDPDAYIEAVAKRNETRRERQERIAAEREQQAQNQREQAEYAQRMQEEIPAALQAVGLPVNELSWELIRREKLKWLKAGEDITLQHAASLIGPKYDEIVHQRFDGLGDDGLLGYLGDERAERIRAQLLKKLGQPGAPAQRQEEPPARHESRPGNGLGTLRLSDALRQS